MLKYVGTSVVFQEVPDEISLAFTISNCGRSCKGCHSPELQTNIGKILDTDSLIAEINRYEGLITCVLFMGTGGGNVAALATLCSFIKDMGLKVAIYTSYEPELFTGLIRFGLVDVLKTGAWNEKLGGLSSPTTNQRYWKVDEKFNLINNNKIFIERREKSSQ